MGRHTGDEDVRTKRGTAGRTAGSIATARSSVDCPATLEQAAEEGFTSGRRQALCELLMRDDGWLRAIPDGEGNTAYLKWKFTRGQFSGSYVMVVVRPWEHTMGFTLLLDKIRDCYEGLRKPTRDRDYLPILDEDKQELGGRA